MNQILNKYLNLDLYKKIFLRNNNLFYYNLRYPTSFNDNNYLEFSSKRTIEHLRHSDTLNLLKAVY